ncbi:hypothetical protein GCM10023172_09460 [Hymenobacter ginsengisoli]|uniref:Uncharacterized protein n=1 Tax=Hymenobacter ginsengisoli TaxID=1051626 RepID=A0ABP8Q207_9BACT
MLVPEVLPEPDVLPEVLVPRRPRRPAPDVVPLLCPRPEVVLPLVIEPEVLMLPLVLPIVPDVVPLVPMVPVPEVLPLVVPMVVEPEVLPPVVCAWAVVVARPRPSRTAAARSGAANCVFIGKGEK